MQILSSALFCTVRFNALSTIAELANRVNLDEVAHNEPPHLDLHCFNSQYDIAWTIFLKFADENFC